ncbi:GGDEF domain-containing protein [Paenibacillus sp. UNC451MF]|uniref:GGDEF domain-containing protein n=1 Tax=Paenibacillus sp. UNC451MF TaxID=1449063 RepID=UPI00048E198A|nr:GGDEF domain-containing protein [Paenibacillus sp. UNC451MF]
MDLLLDAKTIFISLGIGHLFTLILISAYWHDHAKDITVKTFFLAKCAQTTTWFFQAFRGKIPDALSISLANSILFIGATLEVLAILSLQSALRPMTKKIYFIVTALSIIGFQLIVLFYNEEYVRIAYSSIITAAIVIPVYRMILGKTRTLLMKMMGYLYLFVIATSLIRGTVALLSPQKTSLFIPGVYQTMAFLALYIVMILGNTGFILLLKEKADQELIRLASYDDLTGTLNRRTFTSYAAQYLTDYAKKKKPLSYMLFDIDWFKTINDTYGHNIGDQVLQDLTTRIKQHLGEDALFVRYGGDEFGILLPGKDEAESTEIAQQIIQSLNGATSRDLPIAYSISMGILTIVPDHHTQLETLYTSCDKALYIAKNKGRNGLFRGQVDGHPTTSEL